MHEHGFPPLAGGRALKTIGIVPARPDALGSFRLREFASEVEVREHIGRSLIADWVEA